MLRLSRYCALSLVLLPLIGCATLHHPGPLPMMDPPAEPAEMPRELSKTLMPEYIIEPPDILMIEAMQLVPKPPYRLRTGDQVLIEVQGVDPVVPINGVFVLQLGGVVDLGAGYGTISVTGMTIDEAKLAIEQYLRKDWRDPVVAMSLVQIAGLQQIAGEHLVGPTGEVTMGVYGSVSVVGLTVPQAREAIEKHLSEYLDEPEISVEIFSYNSKVYYIVTEGAGMGDQVLRLPSMGSETVLDAMANMGGMTSLSSKHIWIARPTPYSDQIQILPVDWTAITKQGSTLTNYQILPGDRIFIAENELVALDTRLGKLFAPFERISGFSTLMLGTMSRFSGNVLGGGSRGGIFVPPLP